MATESVSAFSGFGRSSLRRSSRKKNAFGADIRTQLNDQLKCLDIKLETEVAIVAELQEFFRRRAELEQEHSRNLDKLVRNMITRHRAEKQKQEQWATMSTYGCWKLLLAITRKQSQDHQTMAEIYTNHMVPRLAEVVDNSHRIFKKCREIGAESHEDIMKILSELQSAMKTYHIYQSESKQAEMKLKNVESQKQKVEQQLSGKNTTSRKLKGLERQTEKKQHKYAENKLKALKARNDYLLSIDTANAAINKYFSDDISDLMDCMDFGYHYSVGRVMMMYLGIHEHQKLAHMKFVESINKCITELDSRADKQKFMELNNIYFMLPKKFEFQPYKGDEVCQISAQKEVQDDLVQRQAILQDRLNSLKIENDEVWKTLETTERVLVDSIQVKDYDVTKFFAEDTALPKSPHELVVKHKPEKVETEAFYLEKFREYTLSCNRLARLQAKFLLIQKALGDNQNSAVPARPPVPPPKPKKRRIGHHPPVGQPKLFLGSLEEYVEATGQEIPLIIKSCIRVINLYGLHHQGVFRVSGAQVEISQFKNVFESGEDALAHVVDASDINSVAGVLKLYFRELREPLFPLHLFDALVECAREKEMSKRVERIKDLLCGINRPIWIVMRYLFAFLNHLTEFSDENMMDPYNLAICFGPTLLPVPPDRDQVTFQSSVNEIIKIIIVHQEEIFPNDGGEIYEKILDRRDSVDGLDEDGEETASIPSDEEEPDVMEAVAAHDFDARSSRELSFKKGDTLILYGQVSPDWWEGCFHDKEGLIPDKYIRVRDDYRSQDDSKKLIGSSTTLPSRPSRQISDDSGLDSSDKSFSQPNMSFREITHLETNDELSPPPIPWESILQKCGSATLESWVKKEGDTLRSSGGVISPRSSSILLEQSPLIDQTKSIDKIDRPSPQTNSADRDINASTLSPTVSPCTSTVKACFTESPVNPDPLIFSVSSITLDPETFPSKNLEWGSNCDNNIEITNVSESPDSSTEDISVDIDTALEEVMAGLKSLEMQQKLDKRMSLPAVKVKQTPKHTPDLVLDLPDGDQTNSCTDSSEQNSPTLSAAETFAKSNQGTLKKAGHPPIGRQDPASRLSISSEPGDLARCRDFQENRLDLMSSQVPLSSFSLKRAHSFAPRRDHLVDSLNRDEICSASSSVSLFSPGTSSSIPLFASSPVFTQSPALQSSLSSITSAPPPVAQKPKVPMKVKPPVMKKPTSRPDLSESPPMKPPQ